MRKEQGDGAGRWYCPLPSVRTVALLAMGGVTFAILYWVARDQDIVQKCHELIGSPGIGPQIVRNVSGPMLWNYNWDKKAFSKPEMAQGVGVRTLLLIRHGQYDMETGKLTPLGHSQANLTGQRLRALNMNYKVIYYHSTMERAQQTAAHLRDHLPYLGLIADEDIQEGGPIPPDPTVSYWKLPDRTYFVDGPRLEAAFRKHFFRADASQKEQTFEIFVGHANIFRFFALRALQLPSNAWMRVFIAHASITLLHINPDGTVAMTRFGDSGHFPPNHVTY